MVSVGQLDINSEGLLLLTNDGGLAAIISIAGECLEALLPGALAWSGKRRSSCPAHAKASAVDGVSYGPMETRIEGPHSGANAWLVITLKEGKNREIRRVMARPRPDVRPPDPHGLRSRWSVLYHPDRRWKFRRQALEESFRAISAQGSRAQSVNRNRVIRRWLYRTGKNLNA